MPPDLQSVERIGPYRLLERLGAGGMGEVFLAYDERLDRRVAIKSIRPGKGIDDQHRERFRREARLAARLSHPAIVPVYDILQEHGTDYIVMEYVEGTSLAAMIERGPLPFRQVLELARELADGLDAAHREGIVHRDLKTENVLVTPSGRPKITDFGIAKQILAEGGESLTADHTVLGTCRVMSPEQARGEPVDHRTDLFALGVLLYEALTGLSPFAAENSLATLNRVIHHRQTPVRQLTPDVPQELSQLVDHLLEKDALLRPQSSGQVRRELDRLAQATPPPGEAETVVEIPAPRAPQASLPSLPEVPPIPRVQDAKMLPDSALTGISRRRRFAWRLLALVLVAGLGTWLYYALRPRRPPLYVAVLKPEVQTLAGASELELLASSVRTALIRGLVNLEGISPKGAEEIGSVAGSPAAVARAVAADEVVSSRLECRPEVCRITLDRLRGDDGSTLWTESFEVPADDFYLVANAAAGQIRRAYPDHEVRKGTLQVEGSSAGLKRFAALRQRFDERRETDLKPLLDECAAIRAREPRFLDVYLLEADIARHRFVKTRDPEDLARAYARTQAARALAPGDPQPLFLQIDIALDAHELEKAGDALQQLRGLIPGDVRVIERQARLLKARGDLAGAIRLLRQAAQRQPSWKRLATLARMEIQNGQIPAAREHLNLLLSRSPENFDGLSLLAQTELTVGSPERAAELYERIVRRSPGLVERSNLSVAYFLLGRYAAAAGILEQLVEQEAKNPGLALNLADAYTLLGKPEKAAPFYRRVEELVDSDPAGGSPELLASKGQALAHLGQGPQAAAAVQEASRLAPDNADIAYQASLVYAVLGEESSALVQAEKALKLGYEPRWFTFPWFAHLRTRPELQSLLESARPLPGPEG